MKIDPCRNGINRNTSIISSERERERKRERERVRDGVW